MKKIILSIPRLQTLCRSMSKVCGRGTSISLEKQVEDDLNNSVYKYKNYPNKHNMRIYAPPEYISQAVDKQLETMSKVDIESSKKLFQQLKDRKTIPEESDFKVREAEVLQKLKKTGVIGDEIVDEFDDYQKKMYKSAIRTHVYVWNPIHYDYDKSLQYLLCRSTQDFASLCNVLGEIKRKVPDFEPETVFDFGSGVGTVNWSLNTLWPGQCKDLLCIDVSSSMNKLNERITEHMQAEMPQTQTTSYREYLPSSDIVKYDLVVSSRSLFELGNMSGRCRTIDILWRKVKPNGFLVLIENGNINGYSLLIEARDYLLQMSEHEEANHMSSPCHVFAPCPHDQFCPKYHYERNAKCSFPAYYFNGHQNFPDNFSYVVLRKQVRPDVPQRPRLVGPVKSRGRHVHCFACLKEGSVAQFTITASNSSKNCYKLTTQSDWGDELPIHYELENKTTTQDEQ